MVSPARFATPSACLTPIEPTLSRQLISGEITDHTRVTVEFKKGELVFETKATKK